MNLSDFSNPAARVLAVARRKLGRARNNSIALWQASASRCLPTDLMSKSARQWPLLAVLALAIALTGFSFALRVIDASDPRAADDSLDRMRVGIYASVETAVTMQYRQLSEYSSPPAQRWHIEIEPASRTSMRASLVLMTANPLYELNIDKPITIVAAVPYEARWGTTKSNVMPDGLNCASWYDGRTVRLAHPIVRSSFDGSVVVICKVPAVGKVQQLTFDLRIRFKDQLREGAGFGRSQSGLRMEGSWMPDAGLSSAGLDYMLRQPAEVQLKLPADTRLAEAFPEPTGGSAGTRSWRIGDGFTRDSEAGVITGDDITYRLEYPGRRVLVQPSIELLLLLAGVAFGLAPSLRRRP